MTADLPAPVHEATGDRIDVATLYALLTLRVDVFVVEQDGPYRELDGADLDATTRHLWVDEPAERAAPAAAADEPAVGPLIAGTGRRLVAGARLLAVGGELELGRIVVAPARRRRGLGAALVQAGSARADRPLHLNAQVHLEEWYARLGFVPTGAAFDWAGIPHVPMRREP